MISEIAAPYTGAVPGTAEECLDFSITLPDSIVSLEHPALILCLRYRVKGHEFWDNNNGSNYRVRFCQPAAADIPSPAPWTVAVGQGPALLRMWDLETASIGGRPKAPHRERDVTGPRHDQAAANDVPDPSHRELPSASVTFRGCSLPSALRPSMRRSMVGGLYANGKLGLKQSRWSEWGLSLCSIR